MGPSWGRQDPGGPHVGPMNFAIWGYRVHPKIHADIIREKMMIHDVYVFAEIDK